MGRFFFCACALWASPPPVLLFKPGSVQYLALWLFPCALDEAGTGCPARHRLALLCVMWCDSLTPPRPVPALGLPDPLCKAVLAQPEGPWGWYLVICQVAHEAECVGVLGWIWRPAGLCTPPALALEGKAKQPPWLSSWKQQSHPKLLPKVIKLLCPTHLPPSCLRLLAFWGIWIRQVLCSFFQVLSPSFFLLVCLSQHDIWNYILRCFNIECSPCSKPWQGIGTNIHIFYFDVVCSKWYLCFRIAYFYPLTHFHPLLLHCSFPNPSPFL